MKANLVCLADIGTSDIGTSDMAVAAAVAAAVGYTLRAYIKGRNHGSGQQSRNTQSVPL